MVAVPPHGGGDPLPHEAAHLMLVFAVNDGCAGSLKQKINGYGSYLPDWVDEGWQFTSSTRRSATRSGG